MLFFISEEVASLAENRDRKILDSLYSLGYFWRTGCCLVDGRRRSLLKLVEIGLLKEDYELILNQKQSVLGLYEKIEFFILLQVEDGRPDIHINGAIGKSININKFENRIKFGLNIMLCENIRDYDFYKWGAEYFSDIDNGIFKIHTLGYNGGGAVIVEAAKHIEDYPCLVICDNDKKYPEDDEGGTLREFRRFYHAARPLLMWKYELIVHEVENLIPHNLICMAYGTKGIAKKMKNLKTNVNYGEFFRYFDFKEGFKKSTLRRMYRDGVRSYNNYLAMLTALGVTQQKINTALVAQYQRNESPLQSGLCGNLMELTLDFINSHYLEQPIIIDDHQLEDWDHIIKMVWSIGCANVPRRL